MEDEKVNAMGPPLSGEPGEGPNGSDRCPVARGGSSTTKTSWNPTQWLRGSQAASSTTEPGPQGSCPVKHDGGSNASRFLSPSLEESARHAQTPYRGQRVPLSTHRVVSSIPRADELRPSDKSESKHAPHQPSEGPNWVYPSEQQFYNAMRRKGWQTDETTVPTVVRIHNAVNERGWSEVRRWERELHDNPDPRLVRFLGKPNDTSPKAWVNTNILFYNPPFDRHDWYIDRGDGKEPRRYVIDFYNGEDGTTSGGQGVAATLLRQFSKSDEVSEGTLPSPRPPSLYLDVRPALDSPDAFKDRVHMFFREAFPGIVAAFGASESSSVSTQTDAGSNTISRTNAERRNGGSTK